MFIFKRQMEEYEKICRNFRRCKLIELCDGKGVIFSGGINNGIYSDCLDYEPQTNDGRTENKRRFDKGRS